MSHMRTLSMHDAPTCCSGLSPLLTTDNQHLQDSIDNGQELRRFNAPIGSMHSARYCRNIILMHFILFHQQHQQKESNSIGKGRRLWTRWTQLGSGTAHREREPEGVHGLADLYSVLLQCPRNRVARKCNACWMIVVGSRSID